MSTNQAPKYIYPLKSIKNINFHFDDIFVKIVSYFVFPDHIRLVFVHLCLFNKVSPSNFGETILTQNFMPHPSERSSTFCNLYNVLVSPAQTVKLALPQHVFLSFFVSNNL